MKKPDENETLDIQIQKLQALHSSQVSDALDACGVEGALLHIKALSPGMKLIGPAYTIQYAAHAEKSTAFKNAANYIDAVPKKSVVVIDNQGRSDCSAWGELLTQRARYLGIAGTIVFGAVRDVTFIRETNYPLYCTGIYMRSGKNRIKKVDEQCPLLINKVPINPGDVIFADDDGALVIPKHLLAEIISKAEYIKKTEQNISKAIKAGTSLEQARATYGYDQPWLGRQE